MANIRRHITFGVDFPYIWSFLGMMKILEFISLMATWISFLQATNNFPRNIFQNIFLGVHITSWLIVLIWFACYMSMLCKNITFDRRITVFAIFHLIICVVQFLIGSIIAHDAASLTRRQCLNSNWCDLYDLAAAMGMVSSLLFLIDAVYHWTTRDSTTNTNKKTQVTKRGPNVTVTRTVYS